MSDTIIIGSSRNVEMLLPPISTAVCTPCAEFSVVPCSVPLSCFQEANCGSQPESKGSLSLLLSLSLSLAVT